MGRGRGTPSPPNGMVATPLPSCGVVWLVWPLPSVVWAPSGTPPVVCGAGILRFDMSRRIDNMIRMKNYAQNACKLHVNS